MSKKIGPQPSDFVHLHNHTHYSLLDGLQKIPEMVQRAKELGMEALAITDHGTLSGAIDFYKIAKDAGIKPIIGIETYVASRKHTDKDPSKDRGRYHLILLAMNMQGYRNLMRLSTIANLEGFYHKPRIDRTLLEQYSEGLICLSACMGGEIGSAIKDGDMAKAEKTAQWYKNVFGDRYYLEAQDHGHAIPEQDAINKSVINLGAKLGIPVVVTSDAHYLKHEDQDVHEILLCVQTGAFVSDKDRMSLKEFDLYLTDPKDVIARWSEKPEIITNTKQIADRCDLGLELGKILIPRFPTPDGLSEKEYLHQLVYRGLAWRYGDVTEQETKKLTIQDAKSHTPGPILDRAEYELGIIDSMGFNGYFLIISDFINWGKNQGIVFGPGRGSAAGSIVSYALRVTELDPMRYSLLFERFLNPDRISMPDVDIDIQDTRRDEVIQYCVEKYGKNRVANIVTFGKMAARAAVRDVARVLQVPYADADRIAKMVPPPVQGRHIPLSKSVQESPDLKREYEASPIAKQVIDMAIRLEGTIRSHGVHAAGVVIAPDDIVSFVPLEMAQKGVVATQYSMGPIEELGLLKMDFLGLSNLTIIKNALRIIKKVYGADIDINTLPLDDKKTFELLQRGDTTGVFQLESAGMKRYLKELKPNVFDDIVAMVALYRPGPMQWIDDFIARKHGVKEIEYVHPAMEPALKDTYGVIVYQEQVMQISKELAGFTGGQADTLRKAIGKKIPEVMKKLKNEFIEGAVKNAGADKAVMGQFWKQLEDFAAYCFNKSHAACYALIAYQTAYLKAHYPAAFMAALMTSDYDDIDRLSIEISECQHMGMTVLQPDVNESFGEFAVVPSEDPSGGKIRFGLTAVKNVGSGAVEEILRVRKREGEFQTIEDFASKVSGRIVNRKVWESLIKAGAFDSFGYERNQLLQNLDLILKYGDKTQSETASGQTDLFGSAGGDIQVYRPQIAFSAATPADLGVMLTWERELLGLYLSTHPLNRFKELLREQAVPFSGLTAEMDGVSATVGGTIVDIREITTKNGQKMAFVKIEDEMGEGEAIVFPKTYLEQQDRWVRDLVVLVKGKVNAKDKNGSSTNEVKIIADTVRIVTPEEAEQYAPTGEKAALPGTKRQKKTNAAPQHKVTTATAIKRLYIRLEDSSDHETLRAIKNTLDSAPGATEVVLVLGNPSKKQIIKLPQGTALPDLQIDALKQLVGDDKVVVR